MDGMAWPTVVIVSYRSPELLRTCLRSLSQHAPLWPVAVVDNLSDRSGDVRELSRDFPNVKWTFNAENLGFGAAVNAATRDLVGDFLLLNPDAELLASPVGLAELLRARPDVGAVGPLCEGYGVEPWDVAHRQIGPVRALVSASGYAHRLRGWRASDLYADLPESGVGYLTGSCLLVRGSAWRSVGAFDERFFLYSEEVDWCRRARQAGWRLVLHPQRLVRHAPAGTVSDSPSLMSRSELLLQESQKMYIDKHFNMLSRGLYRAGMWAMHRLQRSKRGRKSSGSDAAPRRSH
ncbi:glycosyltransferase family 2 protein [Blastococcus sp. SYSU D00820]